MPAIDDGIAVKIYGEGNGIAAQKEVVIGSKRADASMLSGDKLVSFCTDASGSSPVEKAYIDKDGQIVGTAGTSGVVLGNDGTLNVNTTQVGNVGASGPDDLIVYNMPANVMSVTGRGIRVRAWGTTANNANAKSVAMMFGAATLVTKQLTASIAGQWEIEAVIVRTSLNNQAFFCKATNYGGTTVSSTDGATVLVLPGQGGTAATETSAIAVKCVSTVSTADNDIVQKGMIVEFL